MRAHRLVPALACLLATLGLSGEAPAAASTPAIPVPAFAPLAATPLPDGFQAIETDAATRRVFVSSPAASVVTVLGFGGDIQGSVAVPGAGSLLLDGPTLYVASTLGGRIDAFDTTTLALVGSYGGGTLIKPRALVKAGGRVWTTTGDCRDRVRLVSIVPSTGELTVHAAQYPLDYCPYLFTSPVDPNLMLGYDEGLYPPTVVRLDVSSGAPVITATLRDAYPGDAEVFPDGQLFTGATATEIRTFRIDPLEPFGVIYPVTGAPSAVELTAGAGGLLAASPNRTYLDDDDIDVFRIGDPSRPFFTYDYGPPEHKVRPYGLAFSADGTLLFAVSGDVRGQSSLLTVFGPPREGGPYHPLPPARILDTRNGDAGGRIGPGATVGVQVTGQGGVPLSGVSAVAVNVTVTQPTATSFLTLFPAGTVRPLASNLNFIPGKTVPNLVVVQLGSGGRVSMFNAAGSADVIFDVAGWYSDGVSGPEPTGRYTPVVPSRLLDTRDGGVRLGPGESLDLQVAGRGGVPATGALAATLNVTATGTTATSFVTAYPTGQARPLASNLNFNAGDTVSNRAMVKLGTDGRVTIYNLAGSTDIVVDVGGWYSDATVAPVGGVYTALPPARILDTRDTAPLAGGTAMAVRVTGRAGVPNVGVSAVVLNATVVDPATPGYLTIFPTGGVLPLASDVNYAGGEIRPNLTVVQVGADGKIGLYTSATTQIVLDIAGWMS